MCVCPVLLHVNENIFGPERCAEQGGTVNMGNVLVCKVSRDLDSCHSYTASTVICRKAYDIVREKHARDGRFSPVKFLRNINSL